MLESIDTYCDDLRVFIIKEIAVLIVGILGLLAIWFMFCRKPTSKLEKTVSIGFLVLIVIISLWCIMGALIPRSRDLKEQNIIIAENAVYYYDNRRSGNIHRVEPKHATVEFTIDGVTRSGLVVFTLRDNLPEGTYNCTIVYAEESEIILDIIFYDEIETSV